MIYTLTFNAAVDQVMSGDSVVSIPAGKGFNVARDLALLGCAAVAVGVVGADDRDFYCSDFEQQGIETVLVLHPGLTRRNTTTLDPESGCETHVREKGTGVGPEVFNVVRDELDVRLKSGDLLAFCGSLPPGICAGELGSLIALARDRGARVLVDSSGEGLRSVLASPPDIIKVNADELQELTSVECSDEAQACSSARTLLGSGIDIVIVTLGPGGAILVDRDLAIRVDAPPVEVFNTVGAGDAFTAGFLAAAEAGRGAALIRAVACGSAQVTCNRIGELEPDRVEGLALMLKAVSIDPSS